MQLITDILLFMAALFITTIGAGAAFLVLVYLRDRLQSNNAIHRNYPVLGHMRYILKELGIFLRSYFFAADREELPFNRFQREFVNNMADDKGGVIAFGSDYDLHAEGAIRFANSFYPTLSEDVLHVRKVTFGPDTKTPYTTDSYFNISGTSYGSMSGNAIKALSRGAKLAGAWHNTGEGGFSPFHAEGGGDTVFQIGTANYGVRDANGNLDDEKLAALAANPQIVMFEIKLSQGAKPGKGGILPAAKVTKIIAQTRGIEEGKDSVSPNRRADVANADELAALMMCDYYVRPPHAHEEWYMEEDENGELRPRETRPTRVYEDFDTALMRFRLQPEQPCANQFIIDYIGTHSLREVEGGWTWKFDPHMYRDFPLGEDWPEIYKQLPLPTAAMFGELSHDWENISRNEIIAFMKQQRPNSPHFDLLNARHHVLLDQPLAFASSIKQQMANWQAEGAFAQ